MSEANVNDLTGQMADFAKAQATGVISTFFGTLKNSFSFKGRATRKEYWTFFVGAAIIEFILLVFLAGLGMVLPSIVTTILSIPIILVIIFFTISLISVSVRRLHDLDLSGFWIWYLSPLGLPVVFMVNLLDLDKSCNMVLEKISKACNNWVSWLLLPWFWFFGAPIANFLLFLYKGKNEDNQFGPSPYAE